MPHISDFVGFSYAQNLLNCVLTKGKYYPDKYLFYKMGVYLLSALLEVHLMTVALPQ